MGETLESRMQVEGMTCEHCVRAVTGAASRVPGVARPRVELATGMLSWHGDADHAAVRQAIEEEGYRVR
ncbi:heavy-metal-associated domain-containing protein [Lichenicoccus roseus]|uniref:Heavy-metal-associated domain-containing protein n=1 Tax=Lichenicoccus roseus TaxID=2683649 RepID=A0A5R9J133_9PROT|nr:cation transporter [Lichenicoccus roseus]TLU71380.1 heavy-metal-associated domain-containing protein [Lichenicoccus roseus]